MKQKTFGILFLFVIFISCDFPSWNPRLGIYGDNVGFFRVGIFWGPGKHLPPVVEGELVGADGNIIPLDFKYEESRAYLSVELAEGGYCLCLRFQSADNTKASRVAAFCISRGETIHGELFLASIEEGNEIDFFIDGQTHRGLELQIKKRSVVAVGDPLSLHALVDAPEKDMQFYWFVNGVFVDTGKELYFEAPVGGIYQVDLAAISADYDLSGSLRTNIYASPEFFSYTKVASVQGASHKSPFIGGKVVDVLGIITMVGAKGFWMQSPCADGDFSTSEGIYIYTERASAYEVGNMVLVDGIVREYGSGNDLKITEIIEAEISVVFRDCPLPEPVVFGPRGILPPSGIVCNDAFGDLYSSSFDPEEDALDFYESLEGMRVEIADPIAVGGSYKAMVSVVPHGVFFPQSTPRGGLYASLGSANTSILHIQLGYSSGKDTISADIGDFFLGPVQGILHYKQGNYILIPSYVPALKRVMPEREVSGISRRSSDLAVASFNLNYFPTDKTYPSVRELKEKTKDISLTIVNAMKCPDIIGLQEIADDSYGADNGVVSGMENILSLIRLIEESGGPSYEYLEIPPVNNQDGGKPGANIRVGFLYNPLRLGCKPLGTLSPTGETRIINVQGQPVLSVNPGRFSIDSFAGSRKSLAAQFSFLGRNLFVINNHFVSKRRDQSSYGENQPPLRSSEEARHRQARAVADFVKAILQLDDESMVIVLGDFNDHSYSKTLEILKSAPLHNLAKEKLPPQEQYSYVYQGNSQLLDHILVSPALFNGARIEILHRYAEYSSNNRFSDHDPVLAIFSFSTEFFW